MSKKKKELNPKQLAAEGLIALIVGTLLLIIDKYII